LAEIHQFTRVDFRRFKALNIFTLNLRHYNILVGPNNAGKSTILAAFRILSAALRKAAAKSPEIVRGPHGQVHGYSVDLSTISVAEENIFFNYDDTEPAQVTFTLSNRNQLLLYFPEARACSLIPLNAGKPIRTPSSFRAQFNCEIGFVPILGPVEHDEYLYEKEAARRALFNYQAARNFRNIWHHYPEAFEEFRSVLKQTWPGMDIERPIVDVSHKRAKLHMFCPEERIPREIFWSGFGFQVWCQMLTHLIQSKDKSLFLIDEPDIYLHSDLQRQLLVLLRNLGPDILIATHSTEMISEAEPDDILIVNKHRNRARRIKNPSELAEIFEMLGSNLNPILTQLAKTRRALFVEGKDFQIIGRFANKLNSSIVSSRNEFAVLPVEGFSPDRVRSLKRGIETTLGTPVNAAVILDRDYRSDSEREQITKDCKSISEHIIIHRRKEIENFLLVPSAIDRAASRRIADKAKRTGIKSEYIESASKMLAEFCQLKKSHVMAQFLDSKRRFSRLNSPTVHDATITLAALEEFELGWSSSDGQLALIPGKEAVSFINKELQQKYGISITPTAIIDAMQQEEIPSEVVEMVNVIAKFAKEAVD
jgi:AAA domain, putative AbiEii toxin, Type IV TA system